MGAAQLQPYPASREDDEEQYHDSREDDEEQYHDAETYANEFNPLNKLHQPELMRNVSDFLGTEIPATTRKNEVLSTCTPDTNTFRTTASIHKHGGRACPEFMRLSDDDACCVFSTKDSARNSKDAKFLGVICHAMRNTTTRNPLRLSRFVDWVRREVCPRQPTQQHQYIELQANDEYFSEIKYILETFQPAATSVDVQLSDGPIQKLPFIGFFRGMSATSYHPGLRSLVDVSDMPRQISANAKRIMIDARTDREPLWTGINLHAVRDRPFYFLPQSTSIEKFLSDLIDAMKEYAVELYFLANENMHFEIKFGSRAYEWSRVDEFGVGIPPSGYTPLYVKEGDAGRLLEDLSRLPGWSDVHTTAEGLVINKRERTVRGGYSSSEILIRSNNELDVYVSFVPFLSL